MLLTPGIISKGMSARWRAREELEPNQAALDPGNIVWITGGPLTGTAAPSSGRLAVINKSAVNGLLGHSNTGGKFGARGHVA